MQSVRNKLIIIGLGETADLAFGYFTFDSDYDVVAFSAERQFITQPTFKGLPVVPLDELVAKYSPTDYSAFVAISSTQLNTLRTRLYKQCKEMGYSMASYVSSKAFVGFDAHIGENCFILENNTIQPFVTIEDNVVMWSGNHVGHRSIIHNNCFITSHVVISGFCEIGENCFIGVNSSIADNVSIGNYCLIGIGSIIAKDIEPNSIYKASYSKKQLISAKDFYKI